MNILFASTNLPWPANSGGSQRTAMLLRSLESFAEVDCAFLLPVAPAVGIEAAVRERHCVRLVATVDEIRRARNAGAAAWLPPAIRETVCAYVDGGRFRWQPFTHYQRQLGDLRQYDLIVVRYLQTAITLGLFGVRPIILDVDDYDPERLRMRLNHGSWWKRLTLKRCLRFSQNAYDAFLPRADVCWISNADDSEHRFLDRAIALPNIPYVFAQARLSEPLPCDVSSKIFVMVGTFSYSANVDAVDAFLQRVWRRVWQADKEACFHIVGGGVHPRLIKRWGALPGVKVIGYVEHLKSVYASALATVAPILAGGGTNMKVLEAAAYGRMAILSPVASRGFGDVFDSGKNCLIVNNLDSMADECIRLLRSPSTAKSLGEAAFYAVSSRYAYDRFSSLVESTCREVLNGDGFTE